MNDLPLNHVARRDPAFLQPAPEKNAFKAWPFIFGLTLGGVAVGLAMGRLHSVEVGLQLAQAEKDRQTLVAQARMNALEATLYLAAVDAVRAELENPELAQFQPMHGTTVVKNGLEWILNLDCSSKHFASPRIHGRAQVFFEMKDLQHQLKDVQITMF